MALITSDCAPSDNFYQPAVASLDDFYIYQEPSPDEASLIPGARYFVNENWQLTQGTLLATVDGVFLGRVVHLPTGRSNATSC